MYLLWLLLLAAHSPDRAYDLVGTWSCESRYGSIGAHVYVRNSDGSMTMRNEFRLSSGQPVTVEETYRYDARRAGWTISTPPDSWFGAINASAPPWSGKDWTFEGTRSTERAASPHIVRLTGPVRLTYRFPQRDRLERHFQVQTDGIWEPYSDETCARSR